MFVCSVYSEMNANLGYMIKHVSEAAVVLPRLTLHRNPLGYSTEEKKATVSWLTGAQGGHPPPTPSQLFLYLYGNIVHTQPHSG